MKPQMEILSEPELYEPQKSSPQVKAKKSFRGNSGTHQYEYSDNPKSIEDIYMQRSSRKNSPRKNFDINPAPKSNQRSQSPRKKV